MGMFDDDYEIFAKMIDRALSSVVDFPRGLSFHYERADATIDRLVASASEADVRKALAVALKTEVRQRTKPGALR